MKVSIIIRCFNRLEYTTQCINSVIYNAGYENYEIIVVNQGSTDGTKEWLNWIKKMPNKWYEKVIPIHLKRNYGDFGGMKVGFKYTKGNIIMQLDNDIYMETKNWLSKMIYAFEALNADVLMADRKGFKEKISYYSSTLQNILYDKEKLICAKIPKAVSCYLIKRTLFESKYKSVKNCRQLTTGDNCWKIINVYGFQIEGYDPDTGTYIQHDKYNFQIKKQFLSRKWIFKYGLKR